MGLDIGRDDDNWGIDVYCEAVLVGLTINVALIAHGLLMSRRNP